MIKVNHIHKYFNRGKSNEIHVLNDVSLTFPEKGLVVILGASGSGKTTLLNVIGGLDSIKSGTINFGSQDVSDYKPSTWDHLRNEHVGYIFQNYLLQPQLSVYDNIAFVLNMLGIVDKEEVDNRVNYILKQVGMYSYRRKKALQLSGGQQQRVAIARALVKNPSIVIADEPTGNLDSKNTTDVMNIIAKIAQEKLVVMVTHEKEIAQFYANRIIEVVDGKVVNDYENIQSEDHGLEIDEAVYLKDLELASNLEDGQLSTKLYLEGSQTKPIKVDFIVKNNTLYLNIDSDFQNVKLAKDHGIIIKDEHYVPKTKTALQETAFNLEALDTKHAKKEHKRIVSVKRSFKYALYKVLSVGRKGKLMFASFALAGMLVAISVSLLFQSLIVKPELTYDKNAVHAITDSTGLGNSALSYDDLMAIDAQAIFYPRISANLIVNTNLVSSSLASFSGNMQTTKHLEARDYRGDLPTSANEVMVSQGFLNKVLKDVDGFDYWGLSQYSGNDFGIWNEKQFLLENFSFAATDTTAVFASVFSLSKVKVTGIVNFDAEVIYLSEAMYTNFLRNSVETNVADDVLFKTFYNKQNNVVIVSTEKEAIKNHVLLTTGTRRVLVNDLYEEAYEYAKETADDVSKVILPIALLFLGFTFVGFYFVLRSSLISRVSEVSIYRALGVKRTEIISMFAIETMLLTSVSTFIGYLIGSLGVYNLQKSLLNALNYLTFSGLSFVFGLILIYALNLIAGLLPVWGLLRQTPAQIMSKYDI